MKFVLVLSVMVRGLNGGLIDFIGVDLVTLFSSDVGENWFLVRL